MYRQSTNVLVACVNKELTDNDYLTAKQLAEKLNISVEKVRRIVKIMRLQNIGVIPSKNGYVLAKFASKQDDVHFMRVLYGQRAAAQIAIEAAKPHITKRWNGVEDKKRLQSLLLPFSSNTLKKGMSVLLSSDK